MPEDLPIPTIADFERVLDENPQIRESIRRKLLTDEERELPRIVEQLTEQVRQLTQAVADGFAAAAADRAAIWQHVEKGFADATADRAAIKSEMAQGFAAAAADRAAIKADIVEIKADINRIDGRLDNGFGANYETKVNANIGSIAGAALGLRRVQVLKSVSVPRDQNLSQLVDQAEDEGRISDAENDALWLLDLIFTGRRRTDHESVYIAAEVSITAGDGDVSRACDRAAILNTVLDADVVPALITARIDPERTQLAKATGVTVMIHPWE